MIVRVKNFRVIFFKVRHFEIWYFIIDKSLPDRRVVVFFRTLNLENYSKK